MNQANIVVLDDYEGELEKAPAMKRLQDLAKVTILDRPLEDSDEALLSETHMVLALRERTPLDQSFFERCPKLELVLQTGGHAYHVDTEAASQRGVVIALGRGRTTKPPIVVPELVFGLILGLTRQIYPLQEHMRQGQWPTTIGGSLHGRTLGILGYGRHGRPVARLAEAFGMKVLAWCRDKPEAIDEFGVKRCALDTLLEQSDIVSIHLRLSETSSGLIGKEQFTKMKPSAFLINTSRGAIINEPALIHALKEKQIAGAGLDVFEHEPLADSSPLRSLPNVLLTPHIGWKVQDVLHEFVAIAVTQLEAWIKAELSVAEILNPEAMTQTRLRLGGLAR